jgi:hypothetical protein
MAASLYEWRDGRGKFKVDINEYRHAFNELIEALEQEEFPEEGKSGEVRTLGQFIQGQLDAIAQLQ